MVSIARKNLFHDRIRFVVALLGIIFAVVLITVQIGVFLRFLHNASVIVDNTEGDLWVTAKNIQNFEYARPMSEKRYHLARPVPGVEWVEKLILSFAFWRMPDGGQTSVIVVGFDAETGVGAPWDVVRGDLEDLKSPDRIFLDEDDLERLGNPAIGDVAEINEKRARVAGITRGAKSFVQSPYVFTSYDNAYRISFVNPGEVSYLLVKVAPGFDVEDVRAGLSAALPLADVYTKDEFSVKSRLYWMVTTGAGVALLSSALMGLVIGTIIVGQTIYSSTTEHLREFGTLKAIGASNRHIYGIIIEQALINAVLGYGCGMAVVQLVIKIMKAGGLGVLLPGPVLATIFFVTAAMCVVSSVISIYKVTRIDPALVFKA